MTRRPFALLACLPLALVLACGGDDSGESSGDACLTLGCGGDLGTDDVDTTTTDTGDTGDSGTTTDSSDTTTTDTTTTTTGSEDCDPLAISCPVIGESCTWDGSTFHCAPGMTKLGDSCVPGGDLGCIAGFCAPQAEVPGCPSMDCCAGFCNLEMPYCSFAGTSCMPYFPAGATDPKVGACIQ
ncbi:MAG: hypothetical protein KC431_18915 [Myxococcales bacterium]|nr:hypothetical protein [Myxococcales bacterium]